MKHLSRAGPFDLNTLAGFYHHVMQLSSLFAQLYIPMIIIKLDIVTFDSYNTFIMNKCTSGFNGNARAINTGG